MEEEGEEGEGEELSRYVDVGIGGDRWRGGESLGRRREGGGR